MILVALWYESLANRNLFLTNYHSPALCNELQLSSVRVQRLLLVFEASCFLLAVIFSTLSGFRRCSSHHPKACFDDLHLHCFL